MFLSGGHRFDQPCSADLNPSAPGQGVVSAQPSALEREQPCSQEPKATSSQLRDLDEEQSLQPRSPV